MDSRTNPFQEGENGVKWICIKPAHSRTSMLLWSVQKDGGCLACMDAKGGVPCLAWEHMHLEGTPNWATPCLDYSLEGGRPNEARRSKSRMCSIRRAGELLGDSPNPFAECSQYRQLPKELQRGKLLTRRAEDHWASPRGLGAMVPRLPKVPVASQPSLARSRVLRQTYWAHRRVIRRSLRGSPIGPFWVTFGPSM